MEVDLEALFRNMTYEQKKKYYEDIGQFFPKEERQMIYECLFGENSQNSAVRTASAEKPASQSAPVRARPDEVSQLLQRAAEAEMDEEFDDAITYYTKAAEKGNLNAQMWLGAFYEEGSPRYRDLSKALHWLQKAAAQNCAEAYNRMAVICSDKKNGYNAGTALTYMKRAVALEPENRSYRENLAKIEKSVSSGTGSEKTGRLSLIAAASLIAGVVCLFLYGTLWNDVASTAALVTAIVFGIVFVVVLAMKLWEEGDEEEKAAEKAANEKEEKYRACQKAVEDYRRSGGTISARVNVGRIFVAADDNRRKWLYAKDGIVTWYSYGDILSVSRKVDSDTIGLGREGAAIVGGLIAGPIGAIAGAVKEPKGKTFITDVYVEVSLKNGETIRISGYSAGSDEAIQKSKQLEAFFTDIKSKAR